MYGKKWYRGNLHTHTAYSDGKVSFEESVSRYRFLGYDFLSITDHWVQSQGFVEKDFLLLSGCEYDSSSYESHGSLNRQVIMHITGIGFTSRPGLEKENKPGGQEIIDAVKASGGIAVFCHPEWCRNLTSDIANLHGFAGIEIYNTLCGFNNKHYSYSGFHIDQLALTGQNHPVFASDDAHYYAGEEGRSYIMVQADTLSRESILDAIINRRFYASQGPWLRTELNGRTLKVTCTPVTEIKVFTNHYGGWIKKGNELITGTEFQLWDTDYYYRVEVRDEKGNTAWTSPKNFDNA